MRLGRILCKHDAQHTFGIHLLHSHGQLNPDAVMITSKLSDTSGTTRSPILYSKTPQLCDSNVGNGLCGHVYLITNEKEFFPCEYRRGCVQESALRISKDFYKDIVDLINEEKLHKLLGLQLIDQTDRNDVELVELENAAGGTVTFYRQDIDSNGIDREVCLRTTTWVAKEELGVVTLKGNESHASKPGGPHKKFVDGKIM